MVHYQELIWFYSQEEIDQADLDIEELEVKQVPLNYRLCSGNFEAIASDT